MREGLKSIYYLLQMALRKDSRLMRTIKQENLIVVLNLHQVSPHDNAFWPPLHPIVFDQLLAFLGQNFEVSLFRELKEIKSSKPLAVLSFDDGYYNFVEYAIPILEKRRLKANMNIIPSCVESGRPMWNIQLYDFLNTAPLSLINEINMPGFDSKLEQNKVGDKLRYGLKISRFLKNRPRVERQELWQTLENTIQKHDFPLTRMMSRGEVMGIAKDHEIGVHSYSHESMEYEEDGFFEDDFRKCESYFRDTLSLALETYAFPNGSCRDEQIQFLRNNGTKNILLVGEDYATAGGDVFPRFTIYGPSITETRFQALGINKKI